MARKRTRTFVGHGKHCPYPNLVPQFRYGLALDFCSCGRVKEELANAERVINSLEIA